MAATKDKVTARGADVPLALAAASGTRDALTDPREGDFVPDLEDKGLHVGEVRQPAEPVLRGPAAAADVSFESLDDAGESKFKAGTYAEQVAANDAWERKQGSAYEGRAVAGIETDPKAVAAAKAALTERQGSSRRSGSKSNVAEEANATASAQAAEDKS